MMPVNQIHDLVMKGKLPKPPELLKEMKNQEPTILEQMTREVREFFEESVKEREAEEKKKRKLALGPRARERLQEKWKEGEERPQDMATYLVKRGVDIGRPGRRGQPQPPMGTGSRQQEVGGKPGNVNPLRRH
jgi:hypothetical protein